MSTVGPQLLIYSKIKGLTLRGGCSGWVGQRLTSVINQGDLFLAPSLQEFNLKSYIQKPCLFSLNPPQLENRPSPAGCQNSSQNVNYPCFLFKIQRAALTFCPGRPESPGSPFGPGRPWRQRTTTWMRSDEGQEQNISLTLWVNTFCQLCYFTQHKHIQMKLWSFDTVAVCLQLRSFGLFYLF